MDEKSKLAVERVREPSANSSARINSGTNTIAARVFMELGIMCLISLFCIMTVIKLIVFKKGSFDINQIVHIFCLVFLTLQTGYMIVNKQTSGIMHYFMLFLANMYIVVFFSALMVSVYGLPEYSRQITILSSVDYFFFILLFFTLWLYQKQFIEDSVITGIVTIFISTAVAIYAGAIIFNLYKPVLFIITNNGTYSETVKDYISIIIDSCCIMSICAATLLCKMSRIRKLSFICLVFLPVVFAVLSLYIDDSGNNTYVLLIAAVIMPICLVFYNYNDEREKEILRHEKEQVELQVSAMISQMQPHFLYNSLSIIAALCEEEPKLAAKATNAFSDYLRENINFANKHVPIPFSEELSHIKIYTWLEKLRFPKSKSPQRLIFLMKLLK